MNTPIKLILDEAFTCPRLFFKRILTRCAPLITNDKLYLEWLWYLKFCRKLDFKHPTTFNEKLQWLKLYDRKDIYTIMVDKYAAKEYVANIIGEEHIIPTLGVWNKASDIDFDSLPNQFVLKCTHDSDGNIICRDKRKLDRTSAIRKLSKSLSRQYYVRNREWPYKNVPHKIIAEQFMSDQSQSESGLMDYKFYCFNGEPKILYISTGLEDHSTASISFVTLDWQFADFHRSDFKPFDQLPPKPSLFSEMLDIAHRLSQGHSFLRVDLYQINGKVYFSELTFSPCSGMMPFEPEEWDLKMGVLLNLPIEE